MCISMKWWTVAALCASALLFAIAVNNAIYELTSPSWLSWHIALRKTYSVGAFALVGYLFRRVDDEWGDRKPLLAAIAGTAVFSLAIEVGQWLNGSKEGLGWNTFDVACGGLGGAIATADILFRRR